MTDWAFFVIAKLHVHLAQPSPFSISAAVMNVERSHRIYASRPMTRLDAMLMRWRVASVHQCTVATDVIFGLVEDPLQTGRI